MLQNLKNGSRGFMDGVGNGGEGNGGVLKRKRNENSFPPTLPSLLPLPLPQDP